MSVLDDFEAEYLAANPQARAAGYVPPAAPTPAAAPADPDPITSRDLAELAAFALTPEGRRNEPDGARLIFAERVRRAEAEAASIGEVRPAPAAQSVAGPEPDAKAWAELSDLARTVNPLTGKFYTSAGGIEGQRIREALFAARAAVFRGEAIPAEMLAQVRAGIAADQAEADRLKAKKDREDLKEFRERRE